MPFKFRIKSLPIQKFFSSERLFNLPINFISIFCLYPNSKMFYIMFLLGKIICYRIINFSSSYFLKIQQHALVQSVTRLSGMDILFTHGTVYYTNSFTVYTSMNVECVTVVVVESCRYCFFRISYICFLFHKTVNQSILYILISFKWYN
jgi:hypothetical protein